MAGFTSAGQQYVVRDNLWSKDLKTLLLDELFAMKYVRVLSDFPDGYQFNIPSVGEAQVADYNEGMAIKYNAMDTGNFTFSFDQYKYSANSVSEKFKRDSYWSAEIIAMFVPREHRALMQAVEVDILSKPNAAQTPNNNNNINGYAHRFVGSGTGGRIASADFARAALSLFKANVPQRNLVAIVDATVAYTLSTQANIVNLMSPNPTWGDMVSKQSVNGTRFIGSVFGFDVYVSNYLPNGISETIDTVSVSNGVANYFFSATPGDTLPIVGGFRQMPRVYSEFNKDLQQEEFLTIAEWGFKLYRPENMVTVLTTVSVFS